MSAKAKQEEMPIAGEGVTPVQIAEVDKAIAKYERAKEKRCAESPKEVAAKQELRGLLHANREKLPVDEDGNPFYRSEGVDYVLEEKMKRRRCDDGAGDDD